MSLLTDNVLVLNKYFLAVQVSIVKNSITALCNGNAFVVDKNYIKYSLQEWVNFTRDNLNNPDINKDYIGLIRSPSTKLFAPQVIIFPDCEYTSPLIKTVKYSRRNIYSRDNYICQYCGNKRRQFSSITNIRDYLTLDHVIPRSAGGRSCWANIVTCCKWCNEEKGSSSLEEMGWTLLKTPRRPRWQSHVGTPFNESKRLYWNNFLD